MIPPFSALGSLPPGIHWATWEEIHDRFGYSQYRANLLFGMQIGLHSLKVVGCQEVYIDGSFVTNKDIPGDFDICYEDSAIDWDMLQVFDPTLLNFANKRAAQKIKYGGEFFPISNIAARPNVTFLEFFQTDKNTGDPKGIVGLKLI